MLMEHFVLNLKAGTVDVALEPFQNAEYTYLSLEGIKYVYLGPFYYHHNLVTFKKN